MTAIYSVFTPYTSTELINSYIKWINSIEKKRENKVSWAPFTKADEEKQFYLIEKAKEMYQKLKLEAQEFGILAPGLDEAYQKLLEVEKNYKAKNPFNNDWPARHCLKRFIITALLR